METFVRLYAGGTFFPLVLIVPLHDMNSVPTACAGRRALTVRKKRCSESPHTGPSVLCTKRGLSLSFPSLLFLWFLLASLLRWFILPISFSFAGLSFPSLFG